MTINFTEAELETILAAMEDYVNYDDPEANVEDLIGGISVSDRVDSITEKCSQLLASY